MCLTAALNFFSTISWNNVFSIFAGPEKRPKVPYKVVDESNGRYRIEFTTVEVGSYVIDVTVKELTVYTNFQLFFRYYFPITFFKVIFSVNFYNTFIIIFQIIFFQVPNSPLIAKAYDAGLIKVTDIQDGIVGDLSTFRVDASKAGTSFSYFFPQFCGNISKVKKVKKNSNAALFILFSKWM